MNAQPAPLDLQTLHRFIGAVRDLLTSEVRRQAIVRLCFLLAFALSVNGLNVVNSYVRIIGKVWGRVWTASP